MSNTNSLKSPFIADDAPSMADVLDKLDAASDLTKTQRRDLKSAIQSLCRILGKSPECVVANINWLHIRVRRIAPAAHNISKKRLANIKSGVIKALALTGCSRERSDWLRPPSTSWQLLLDQITDKHDLWKLTQLSQYCSALDISPDAVTDGHVIGLQKMLIEETFMNKPDQVAVNAVKTWNRMREEVDNWPNIQLSRPPRKKVPWTISLEQFPQSFQDDVTCWKLRLENPDPLDISGPRKPLRSVTVKHRMHQIQQAASAAVLSKHLNVTDVQSLSSLINLDTFKAILRYLMNRFEGKPTEAIHGLAVGLKSIAEHHVQVEPEHLKELKAIIDRINLNVDGLRAKNQQRLEQLEDRHNLAALLHLPGKLTTLSKRGKLRAYKAALLVQAALCIEILLYAPMRAGTLSRLHLERHIRFIGSGRKRITQITVPAEEVKNDRDLHYELGPETTKLLDHYIRDARPVLLRQPSEYLFPAQNGDHKRVEHVSGLIKQTVLEHTGMVINAHLFRSIAGKIHSMVAPGDFATLSHVLHNTLQTAMRAYAQFEHKSSIRHYQNSVDIARKKLMSPNQSKKRKP
jgi:integrase